MVRSQAFLGFGLRHDISADGLQIAALLIWLLSPPALAAAAAVRIEEGIGLGLAAAVAGGLITVAAGFLWTHQVGGSRPILLDWLRRLIAAGAVIGGVELIRAGHALDLTPVAGNPASSEKIRGRLADLMGIRRARLT